MWMFELLCVCLSFGSVPDPFGSIMDSQIKDNVRYAQFMIKIQGVCAGLAVLAKGDKAVQKVLWVLP